MVFNQQDGRQLGPDGSSGPVQQGNRLLTFSVVRTASGLFLRDPSPKSFGSLCRKFGGMSAAERGDNNPAPSAGKTKEVSPAARLT